MSESNPNAFSGYQKFIIVLLAFLQFTIILDFMILSPLGAMLMPSLKISPQQFGLVVSIYAFSAGISGFLAGGFADLFDRKRLLIFFYSGFLLGTLFCAIAPTYPFLLAARLVTGVFGGVIGSIVLAIVTDLFPYEKRGRVMGIIQTAFAASQILGLPLGLYLSNHWGWHAPFFIIVAVGLIAGGFILARMKPIDAHLKLQTDDRAVHHLVETVSTPRYLQAFLATALLSIGGFMLMPFASAFSVHNLGVSLEQLPLVYMTTGLCTIFAGPLVGRASDRFGKFNIFSFGSVITILIVLYYTRMGLSPLWLVMLVNAVMFVGIFSRMIPSQALMSAIPEPRSRGSFMAVSSSLQQIAGGVASAAAGAIVIEHSDGSIGRFDVLGDVVIGAILICLVLMYLIHKQVPERTA